MLEGENSTERAADIVEQIDSMSDEEVSDNFFILMSGILDQYPEDTK